VRDVIVGEEKSKISAKGLKNIISIFRYILYPDVTSIDDNSTENS
jgi:hypothetical protein